MTTRAYDDKLLLLF